jgi:hypothetical protein
MEALLVLTMSLAVVAQGGGSLLGLSGVDYPVRAGDPPNPRLRGEGAAARRRNVLVVVLGIGVQKDLCSGLFCKNHGLTLSVISRKKKLCNFIYLFCFGFHTDATSGDWAYVLSTTSTAKYSPWDSLKMFWLPLSDIAFIHKLVSNVVTDRLH